MATYEGEAEFEAANAAVCIVFFMIVVVWVIGAFVTMIVGNAELYPIVCGIISAVIVVCAMCFSCFICLFYGPEQQPAAPAEPDEAPAAAAPEPKAPAAAPPPPPPYTEA